MARSCANNLGPGGLRFILLQPYWWLLAKRASSRRESENFF
jgi:hypothetical protein